MKMSNGSDFTALDWFSISGRGDVAVIHIDRADKLPEAGESIAIDGNNYYIAGVDRHMKMMYPPIIDERVGILVRGGRKVIDSDARFGGNTYCDVGLVNEKGGIE